MKRIRRFLKSPRTTTAAFGLAVVLLLFSSIGGTRAALTYFSETYVSRVQMYNIGVTLMEEGQYDQKPEPVSVRDYSDASDGTWDENTGVLLKNMLDVENKEELKPGKKYKEKLSVRNTGDIDQYVRVSLYKYWTGDGEEEAETQKKTMLDPGLIDLHLTNTTDQGGDWIVDEEASTKERTVLYYSRLLPAGQDTPPFTDTLEIDDNLATKVTQEVTKKDGYTTIKTTYDYDGVKFCIKAKVDAVQDHNAEDAAWSAWGRRVSVENKTLRLADMTGEN